MTMDESVAGLWVIHDPSLDASSPEVQDSLARILAHAADALPEATLAVCPADPARVLLDSAKKYPSASAFVFSLDPSLIGAETAFRGITPLMLRSALLSASVKILSQSGSALAFGKFSIGCILGSASSIDPELTLHHFTKTLKRILPRLAEKSFPQGRTMGIDYSSPTAFADLTRFLSE